MKSTAKIFYILGFFFLLAGIAYGILTGRNEVMGIEPVGFAALLAATGLAFMIAIYITMNDKAHPGQAHDELDAEVSAEAGVQGSFAPYSWWPLWAAAGGALCFLGVAAGWWLFAFGFILAMFGVIGWVLEFSRGTHEH